MQEQPFLHMYPFTKGSGLHGKMQNHVGYCAQ